MAVLASGAAGALSDELKPRQIRANTIYPAIIETSQNRSDMPGSNFDEWVRPDDVSSLIVYLISSEGAGINGQNIKISGRS